MTDIARTSNQWATYQRLGSIEARPWTAEDEYNFVRGNTGRISISPADRENGVLVGGMVARNPTNHDDQWYVAPQYFSKHYSTIPAVETPDVQQVARSVRATLQRAKVPGKTHLYCLKPGDIDLMLASVEPPETDVGLIAALHLLAGQTQSPIHAETARRAIVALGGAAEKASDHDADCSSLKTFEGHLVGYSCDCWTEL
jgi:hypothetical protein